MNVTVKLKVLVVLAGWESVAMTVIVVVPDLSVFGVIERKRFVPEPLKERLALLTRLVFDEVALVTTVKMGTALSVTPTLISVEEFSATVTLFDSVSTGAAARAAIPPKASIVRTTLSRTKIFVDVRLLAPAKIIPDSDLEFIVFSLMAPKEHRTF